APRRADRVGGRLPGRGEPGPRQRGALGGLRRLPHRRQVVRHGRRRARRGAVLVQRHARPGGGPVPGRDRVMPTALDLVDVTPDLGRGTWRVAIGDRAYTVREWTWGERRRLLAACVRDDDGAAALDGASFAQGVVQLLVAPP